MASKRYPEPCCGALIFNQEGKMFLTKSHRWRDKYVIPGGHVELGEKMVDTLKREVKEETGLDIYDMEFICVRELIYSKVFAKRQHLILINFACKTKSRKVTLDSEAQEYVWVTLTDAQTLPVEPNTRRTIQEYIRQHKR
jgi:nucleoside triphosphatase